MQRLIVIDACCTLNLLATRREDEILAGANLALVMGERAHGEAIFLSTPPDETGLRARESASTERLLSSDRLSIRALDTGPLIDAFVACAPFLRDADASCVALAAVLALPLATDDAKERRVARSLFPQIEILTTLDILHDALGALALPESEELRLAFDLRWRGNFVPPKNDPLGDWYADLLRRAAALYLM